jgi:hypothetical protein
MSRKTSQILNLVDLGNRADCKEKDVIICDENCDDDNGSSAHKGKIILVFKLIKAYTVKLYEGAEICLHHS